MGERKCGDFMVVHSLMTNPGKVNFRVSLRPPNRTVLRLYSPYQTKLWGFSARGFTTHSKLIHPHLSPNLLLETGLQGLYREHSLQVLGKEKF